MGQYDQAKYDREITVYVWKNAGSKLNPSRIGHAAVKVRGVPGAPNNGRAYVSWWPAHATEPNFKEGRKKQEANLSGSYKGDMMSEIRPETSLRLLRGELEPRTGQIPVAGFEISEDEVGELLGDLEVENKDVGFTLFGKEADEVIRLPALGATGVAWGLNDISLFRWWEVFRRAPYPKYKMMSGHINCAGVAALALKAAYAESFAKPPHHCLYMEPNHVLKWAKKLEKRLNELNEGAKQVQYNAQYTDFMDLSKLTFTQLTNLEVWTVDVWKKKSGSEAGVSKLATRSKPIKEIDRLLKEYWTMSWTTSEDFMKKVNCLAEIMDQVHQYLAYRQGHKRQDAVLELAQQILQLLKDKEQTYGGPLTKTLNWLAE